MCNVLESSFARFVATVLGVLFFAQLIDGLFIPPDPFTQLLFIGPVIVVALPVAYYLSYRGGYERLATRVDW